MHKCKWLLPILILLSPVAARANEAARGFCEVGGQRTVTSGLLSTNQVQASFPQCTVTVFVHGTGALATIFQDNNTPTPTPLANPFYANTTPGLTGGQWIFYAADGVYDVTTSLAGMPFPVSYFSVLLCDPFGTGVCSTSGGGGGGGGSGITLGSGNLAPLFTTIVTPSGVTTTPLLNFAFLSAPVCSVFGNSTLSPGLPTYFQLPETFATVASETSCLPNSRQLVAGSGITFNTTVPGQISISAGLPAQLRTCMIVVGIDDGAALINADLGPQGRQCFVSSTATVVEVTVAANAGTPTVIPADNHAGTLNNLLSAALSTAASGGLACSNVGGTVGLDGVTVCSATLQNTLLARGDWIDLVAGGVAGGVATRMSVAVTWSQ